MSTEFWVQTIFKVLNKKNLLIIWLKTVQYNIKGVLILYLRSTNSYLKLIIVCLKFNKTIIILIRLLFYSIVTKFYHYNFAGFV